jgi:3-oxoacyl-[acyl-carrier-protein] synthase-3
MAFFKIPDIKIRGISACVPKQIEENSSFPLFDSEALRSFVTTTGIERRRKVSDIICSADLCMVAVETLISDLGWNKSDISVLVFVSQTPDYVLPATSPALQDRLGLNKDCFTLDVSLGCSGWVYGMNVVAALLKLLAPPSQEPAQRRYV